MCQQELVAHKGRPITTSRLISVFIYWANRFFLDNPPDEHRESNWDVADSKVTVSKVIFNTVTCHRAAFQFTEQENVRCAYTVLT